MVLKSPVYNNCPQWCWGWSTCHSFFTLAWVYRWRWKEIANLANGAASDIFWKVTYRIYIAVCSDRMYPLPNPTTTTTFHCLQIFILTSHRKSWTTSYGAHKFHFTWMVVHVRDCISRLWWWGWYNPAFWLSKIITEPCIRVHLTILYG